ncbi:uncharacterized protein LOC131958381 [Physella acuta]|uniref:uncharacterized protein LOC131958381 n=1 Tax=Physella acuta TaxID=109671 RepID=UPI0027DBC04A|nr:uncharacterized protein LOC131958381 [Physella acuta]
MCDSESRSSSSKQHTCECTCNKQPRLGELRETWCAVERMKEEDWARKQKGHIPRYQEEMRSDIFGLCALQNISEPRLTFEPPKKTEHTERRHFGKIHNKSQLKI